MLPLLSLGATRGREIYTCIPFRCIMYIDDLKKVKSQILSTMCFALSFVLSFRDPCSLGILRLARKRRSLTRLGSALGFTCLSLRTIPRKTTPPKAAVDGLIAGRGCSSPGFAFLLPGSGTGVSTQGPGGKRKLVIV